jgi:uncharacterized repeat protein (TIGR01451 family)
MKAWSILAIATIVFLVGHPGAAPANQSAQTTAPAAEGAPNIELTKKCPSLRYVGRDATFELGLTNRGTAPALNVVVTDTLPAGVEFLEADSNGKREGGNIVWQIGDLDAGQSRTLKVKVRCNQITTVRNTAMVTYCAVARAECEFPVKGIPAILLECVDDPDPIEVDGQTTYTITVTNQGTAMGTKIVVECVLPAEEEFVKAGGATEAKADGKSVKFAPLATLAPKAKAVFTVTVKGVKEGDARFRVNLTSDQIETPVMETESTHVY